MSQAEFLRQFDDLAFGAFAAAGMADAAAYLSPADLAAMDAIAGHDPEDPDAPSPPAAPVPRTCTVLVDRNVETYDEEAPAVSAPRIRITFQCAELTPEQGGRVTIGGESFTLVQRTRADESLSAWWVQHA